MLKDKSFAGDEITDIVSIPDEVMTIDNHGVIKFISPQSMLVTRTDSLIAVNTDPSTTFVYTIVPDNDGPAWIFSNEKLWLYDTRSHTGPITFSPMTEIKKLSRRLCTTAPESAG